MAKIEIKKPIVEEISATIKDAQSVVLVDYRGLTVAQDTELRKQLREAGITYKVYKNTMMNFAFKGTDCEGLAPYLEGPSAIAISKDDATAPARILCKFAKTAKALEIKGGVVEGTVYDSKGIEAISNVPSREELLGKLLNLGGKLIRFMITTSLSSMVMIFVRGKVFPIMVLTVPQRIIVNFWNLWDLATITLNLDIFMFPQNFLALLLKNSSMVVGRITFFKFVLP